jgi:predicted Zn-dependent protease with MMP-like domain
MWETYGPPLRAAAITAFVLGLVVLLIHPPSLSGLGDLLALIGGAIAFVLVLALVIVALSGDQMPEQDFERLVERSEALAKQPPADRPPNEFDELVMEALDRLPPEFRELAESTPVVVSHLGREHHAYGLYMGDTVARETYPDRIVIYQDTLERDFGHDRELLRAQVERTVRHEMAHHLGWDERGVRDLGL